MIKMSSHTRKRETSDIWKYFTKTSAAAAIAICKFCNASISRGGKNASTKGFSTSNLWNHLKRSHSEEIDKMDNSESSEPGPPMKKQATIPQILENSKKYAVDDIRAKEITRLIAEEICIDMEPLNHVNKIGFQRLLKKLCPRYEIVSRTHLTQTVLPDMYSRVKSKIQLQLNNITNLCITSDLWSSDSSSQINDFISVTAHGLNNNFEIRNFCLEVMPFEGEIHTGENISDNLYQALNEWNITKQVKMFVTDNARNIVNAIRNIQHVDHFPCMAHSLQLVLCDALFEQSAVKDMVSISRKIVGHFSHSTNAMKKLQIAQEEHNVPRHVLIQDVPTRWDSTYMMLNRLNEQRIAVQAVLPNLNIPLARDLNTQQWILLGEVVKILKYFEDVTKALSEDNVTLADAIPLVNSLFKALEGMRPENSDVRFLIQNLQLSLTERLGNLEENDNCILATILDPRYKFRTFRKHNTTTKTKALLYTAAREIQQTELLEKEEPSSSSEVQPSTSRGIWSICQEIIENVESDEPLAPYASKLVGLLVLMFFLTSRFRRQFV